MGYALFLETIGTVLRRVGLAVGTVSSEATGSCLLCGYEINLNRLLSGCLVRATYVFSAFNTVYFVCGSLGHMHSFCALIPGIGSPLLPKV